MRADYKYMAELGLDFLKLLFGKEWAEELEQDDDDIGNQMLGGLVISGLIFWGICVGFMCIDYTKDALFVFSVVIGYPAIMAYATVRTRRRMKEKAAAREKEKAENPPSDEETH